MDDGGWMDWITQPRGLKRPPEDNLDGEQRLAKRLSLLNLDCNAGRSAAQLPESQRASSTDDAMRLDDTKHKVYIHNLDDELLDDDPQEGKLIFLPDIERQMTKIPHSVLRGPQQPTAAASTNTEVVLYNVPTSLSVPREQDSVRKAIIEARARARERQTQELRSGRGEATQTTRTTGDTSYGNSVSRTLFETPLLNRLDEMSSGMPSTQKNGATQLPQTSDNPFGHNSVFNTAFGISSISSAISKPPLTNGFTTTTIGGANTSFAPPVQIPFANGFNEKPVDIQGVYVVDPDAMEIE
ncbi:MAG: hypothetical protein M1840_008379 [Geoglossum simile]|nr:MAG: hypothetical protein M1840_008379 [Geoglossum simile]